MKLFELLQLVIGKLNKAVSTDPQDLTDEQRAQAKANLGISDSSGGNPDWNQNDPNGEGYVQNRTHFIANSVTTLFDDDVTFIPFIDPEMGDHWNGSNYIIEREPIDFHPGDTVTVSMDGESYVKEVQVYEDEYYGDKSFFVDVEELNLRITLPPILGQYSERDPYGHIEYTGYPVTEQFTTRIVIVVDTTDVVKLPNMFIDSDTTVSANSNKPVQSKAVAEAIAQSAEEVKSGIPKADWSQTDPNGDGYIKNKPFGKTSFGGDSVGHIHDEDEPPAKYVHVSYDDINSDSFIGAQIYTTSEDGGSYLHDELTEDDVHYDSKAGVVSFKYGFYAYTNNVTYDGFTCDKWGLWLKTYVAWHDAHDNYSNYYVYDLTIPWGETVPEKFIPHTIARKSDIPKVPNPCISDDELTTLADLLGVTLEGETNTTQE